MATWTKLVVCSVQRLPEGLHERRGERYQTGLVVLTAPAVQVVDSRYVEEPKAEVETSAVEGTRAWEVVLDHPGPGDHQR